MEDSIQRIQNELEGLGYVPVVTDWPKGKAIRFQYTIPAGSHAGKTVYVAVSADSAYPEYPPHWVLISPPINDGRGGAYESYTDDDGREWLAMSRPPDDIWDRLATKHMSRYISEHLNRIWKDV